MNSFENIYSQDDDGLAIKINISSKHMQYKFEQILFI